MSERIDKRLFLKLVGERIFTVDFTKKNGECVIRTYKIDSASEQVYENTRYNYVTVYDVNKDDYRTLNLDTVFEINLLGNVLSKKDLASLNESKISEILKDLGLVGKNEYVGDNKLRDLISNALIHWNNKNNYGQTI